MGVTHFLRTLVLEGDWSPKRGKWLQEVQNVEQNLDVKKEHIAVVRWETWTCRKNDKVHDMYFLIAISKTCSGSKMALNVVFCEIFTWTLNTMRCLRLYVGNVFNKEEKQSIFQNLFVNRLAATSEISGILYAASAFFCFLVRGSVSLHSIHEVLLRRMNHSSHRSSENLAIGNTWPRSLLIRQIPRSNRSILARLS